MPRRLGIVGLVVGLSGCHSCAEPSVQAEASAPPAASTLTPVPEPDGIVAEIWVRNPAAAWGRLQAGVGGAIGLLPAELGSLVAGVLGVAPGLDATLDAAKTAYGVVGDAASGLGWVVAVPLRDPARAAELLTAGDAGAIVTREAMGVRIVARPDRPFAAAVGLAGAWLLLGSDDDTLGRLGPFAARTMPALPAPASPATVVAQIPRAAFAATLGPRMSAAWNEQRAWLAEQDQRQRARHGGRAPDFGDATALLDAMDLFVRRRIALVAGGRGGHAEAEVAEDHVQVDVTWTPGAADAGEGAVATLRPGDTQPLAAVPGDAIVAVLERDDEATRTSDVDDLQKALLRILGPNLRGDDGRALGGVLDDWADARGDWLTAAVTWGPDHGLWVRTPSGPAGAKVVGEALDLFHRPAFGGPLATSLGAGPRRSTVKVEGLTEDAALASFGGARSKTAVAWARKDGDLLLAAGDRAPAMLAAALSPPSRLGDDPRVARALGALGQDASLVVVARPLRIDAVRGAGTQGTAPAVLAWGRRGPDAWLHVDLADELLHDGLRAKGGL